MSIAPIWQPLRSRPRPDGLFRFKPGDLVYPRGWDRAAMVVEGFLHTPEHGPPCPHYIVADRAHRQWRISQLELSGRPVEANGKLAGKKTHLRIAA